MTDGTWKDKSDLEKRYGGRKVWGAGNSKYFEPYYIIL